MDKRLSHRDVRVYGILACARRGPLVNMGERRIAERAGVDRRSLRASLRKLIECTWVEALPRIGKARAKYLLTSRLFTGKVDGEAVEAETHPGLVKSTVAQAGVARCPKCYGNKDLCNNGICRSCNYVLKTMDYIVEAQRKLGPGASESAVAAAVQSGRVVSSKSFQTAMRMLAREEIAKTG